MLRIAVDMDGVLSDTVEQFISWNEKETGIRLSMEDIAGKPEQEVFPGSRKHLYMLDFFRSAAVVKDSQEILFRLNEKYDVYIVSAATEFPKSLPEKQEWLNEHFPFITWQQMVFCGSKKIILADIMIDDHFKNLDHFSGETTLLFTQPHNIMQNPGKHVRVDNWQEIARILL